MKSKANQVRQGWPSERDPAPQGKATGGAPEPPEAERSETEGGGGAPPVAAPDPEVSPVARRRRFSPKYKLRVLQQADACQDAGEIGALLRREGLYSSHLSAWRRARKRGELDGLAPRRRGRKPDPNLGQNRQIARLEKENSRLQEKLRKAEMVIEVQKKLSELLGLEMASIEDVERTE